MTKKTIGKKYRGKSKNKGFSAYLTCPEILIFFGDCNRQWKCLDMIQSLFIEKEVNMF